MRMLALVASLPFALLVACTGPFGPMAGGRLAGEPAGALPTDWAFTRGVMVVQLETRPHDPYSVNIGCIDHDGGLYVGSAEPQDSAWVANLVDDPRVRLRVAGRLYELRARRVTDPAEWAEAGRKLFEKYDLRVEPGHDPGWLFRLEPR